MPLRNRGSFYPSSTLFFLSSIKGALQLSKRSLFELCWLFRPEETDDPSTLCTSRPGKTAFGHWEDSSGFFPSVGNFPYESLKVLPESLIPELPAMADFRMSLGIGPNRVIALTRKSNVKSNTPLQVLWIPSLQDLFPVISNRVWNLVHP